jgi:phosphopantetheinyl transferase
VSGPERRRVEWLLGRCCAKDAVRRLAADRGQPDLLPADVRITPDENGNPRVSHAPIRPAISISHADGVAMAAAALEPGIAVGLDVQMLDPSRDGFEEVALTEEERGLLPSAAVESRREHALRFWCAKEASAKALGYGMLGGPASLLVRSFSVEDGRIVVELAGALAQKVPDAGFLTVDTCLDGDLVIAICFHSTPEKIHEPA